MKILGEQEIHNSTAYKFSMSFHELIEKMDGTSLDGFIRRYEIPNDPLWHLEICLPQLGSSQPFPFDDGKVTWDHKYKRLNPGGRLHFNTEEVFFVEPRTEDDMKTIEDNVRDYISYCQKAKQ